MGKVIEGGGVIALRVYDFTGRCHRSSVWTNYPHGLQTVGARMKSALRL